VAEFFAAAEKSIASLTEEDVRVSILGTVVAKGGWGILLDDGSGSIRVSMTSPTLENIKEQQLVRVIGRVIVAENGLELRADVLRDATGLDLQLWKKAAEMWARR